MLPLALKLVPTKPTAWLMKQWPLRRKHSRPQTRPTNAPCACWSAPAASKGLASGYQADPNRVGFFYEWRSLTIGKQANPDQRGVISAASAVFLVAISIGSRSEE